MIFTEEQRALLEKQASHHDVYGKLMDEVANVGEALDAGNTKQAKQAADRMLKLAKALHKIVGSR